MIVGIDQGLQPTRFTNPNPPQPAWNQPRPPEVMNPSCNPQRPPNPQPRPFPPPNHLPPGQQRFPNPDQGPSNLNLPQSFLNIPGTPVPINIHQPPPQLGSVFESAPVMYKNPNANTPLITNANRSNSAAQPTPVSMKDIAPKKPLLSKFKISLFLLFYYNF